MRNNTTKSKIEPVTLASDNDPFLTVREVARRLRVDDTTVRRWIKQGILPAITLPQKQGGSRQSYRVPASTLQKYLPSS